jgi:hypothetical protein
MGPRRQNVTARQPFWRSRCPSARLLNDVSPSTTPSTQEEHRMRHKLATVITKVHTMEIDEVNHHVIASGYLITGVVCHDHSTLIMTAVYLWAGLANVKILRAMHKPGFLSHHEHPATAPDQPDDNRQVVVATAA